MNRTMELRDRLAGKFYHKVSGNEITTIKASLPALGQTSPCLLASLPPCLLASLPPCLKRHLTLPTIPPPRFAETARHRSPFRSFEMSHGR